MPPVRKTTEAKFLRRLKNLFGAFTSGLREGSINADNIHTEAQRFSGQNGLSKKAEEIVSEVVREQQKDSNKYWKDQVLKVSSSPIVYRSIQYELNGPVGKRVDELIASNSDYIKTLPWAWADHVVDYVKRETLNGKPPQQIEEDLRKIMPARIQRNLKTIVRTECGKTHAAITEARAENLGVKAYIWHSCRDERVRSSHSRMDGVLVFYDDPPNPEALFPERGHPAYGKYHAGNTFNCRCWMEPVLSINSLPDTIRVHYHGKVAYWNKHQIRKKFGRIAA